MAAKSTVVSNSIRPIGSAVVQERIVRDSQGNTTLYRTFLTNGNFQRISVPVHPITKGNLVPEWKLTGIKGK